MKVACAQMDMAFAKPDENFKKAQALVREAASKGADTILLPETWNTGFFPHENLAELADDDGKRTRSVFGPLAKTLNVNIVAGSVVNRKSDGIYNTALVFNREGECVAEYDKTHLFSPMGEDKYFKKGNHSCSFTLDGIRCAVIICYDLRFPRLTRRIAIEGLDFLFMVSQWPLVRVPHLDTLTKARAIENQMFVACCNSCGTAGETRYGGNSSILDPWGVCLAEAGTREEILTAECDFSVVDGIRNSINVFADRRPDIYNCN